MNKLKADNYLTLAFRVRNSFDDEIIKNEKLNFYLNNQIVRPLEKDNGYYVITNIDNQYFEFKISSKNYFEKIINVNIDEIKNIDNYMEIYLIPNFKYVNPPSVKFIDGIADINTEVFATKLGNRTNVRFLSFDRKKNLLKVSNPAQENLIGKIMAVVNCDTDNFQAFFVKNKISGTDYEIDREINKSYKPSSPIKKAYVSQSDESGKYTLYLDNNNLFNEKYILSFYKNNKKTLKIINDEDNK